jgi:hypothetical protein
LVLVESDNFVRFRARRGDVDKYHRKTREC